MTEYVETVSCGEKKNVSKQVNTMSTRVQKPRRTCGCPEKKAECQRCGYGSQMCKDPDHRKPGNRFAHKKDCLLCPVGYGGRTRVCPFHHQKLETRECRKQGCQSILDVIDDLCYFECHAAADQTTQRKYEKDGPDREMCHIHRERRLNSDDCRGRGCREIVDAARIFVSFKKAGRSLKTPITKDRQK